MRAAKSPSGKFTAAHPPAAHTPSGKFTAAHTPGGKFTAAHTPSGKFTAAHTPGGSHCHRSAAMNASWVAGPKSTNRTRSSSLRCGDERTAATAIRATSAACQP